MAATRTVTSGGQNCCMNPAVDAARGRGMRQTGESTSAATSGRVAPEAGYSRTRILRNLLISFAAFIAAFVLASYPDLFDRPVAAMIGSVAGRSSLFDNLVFSAFFAPTFSGVFLVSLIWFSWFDNTDAEHRSRIFVGTLASIAIGGVSRLLQHVLLTHPRPYYDPAFHFQSPSGFPMRRSIRGIHFPATTSRCFQAWWS